MCQRDDEEKSSQVWLRAIIHQEAAEVLTYPGPASESSDATMNIFHSISAEAGQILFANTRPGYGSQTSPTQDNNFACSYIANRNTALDPTALQEQH
jgi:hypothetical protein